jgi:multicomponent Na+:H+ antiporter subunit G
METVKIIIASVLTFIGLALEATAIIGVFKFKDTLSRMHSAGIADTLGILFISAGMILLSDFAGFSVKFIIAAVFVCCSAPVSSHMIAKMVYNDKNKSYKTETNTNNKEQE